MSNRLVFAVAFVSLGFTIIPLPSRAQGPQVTRTVLLRRDTTVPGYEVVMLEALIPAGGREGRHTHSGTLLAVDFVQLYDLLGRRCQRLAFLRRELVSRT